jgi:ATP-dependent RNA helicase SUPV3L1/SUV3
MQAPAEEPRGITAILGPTNTGKTHHALSRMLEHRSGMIGLPLRLLAREVYDRITTQVGEANVALITGEEKRIPRQPRYYVCTVEAMPTSQEVDFLAVDEIQLCAHRQRGHVFTDRLLNARGRIETWYLGSATIREMLQRFVPSAQLISRPRLSTLSAAPTRNLSRLPPRSAVVAFSAERVYDLATQLRNKRGGTAIVLGALSPRTRNAQVALYQSGEVDYMVATDAIGMGLNLDIDHVAFADFKKFDGQHERPLETAELAQIAGRAGRYLNAGSFGTLAPLPEFAPQVIRAIETHRFPPDTRLMWRNSDLDYSSAEALIHTLREPPKHRGLKLMDSADDQQAFLLLSKREAVCQRLKGTEEVQLLWEICQIPDFRQLWFELHVNLLERLFLQLTSTGRLDEQFINEQLEGIDDTRGDIDTLMGRIADIRTWTYVAAHRQWLVDSNALKERTTNIEDRLSDALHDKLVLRFVERTRTTSISPDRKTRSHRRGQSGPFAGLLDHYLTADEATPQAEQTDWAETLINAQHEEFEADARGRILYHGVRVAQFEAGPDLLHPGARLTTRTDLGPGIRSRMQRRLLAYARDLALGLFVPLHAPAADELTAAARGLVYQLERNLGNTLVEHANAQLVALTERDRQLLTSFGVRFGRRVVYLRRLLLPSFMTLRAALVSARHVLPFQSANFKPGLPSLSALENSAAPWWTSLGYVVTMPLAVRVDLYEALWRQLDHLATHQSFSIPRHLVSTLACEPHQLEQMLRSLGFVVSAGRCRARRPRSDHRQSAE